MLQVDHLRVLEIPYQFQGVPNDRQSNHERRGVPAMAHRVVGQETDRVVVVGALVAFAIAPRAALEFLGLEFPPARTARHSRVASARTADCQQPVCHQETFVGDTARACSGGGSSSGMAQWPGQAGPGSSKRVDSWRALAKTSNTAASNQIVANPHHAMCGEDN